MITIPIATAAALPSTRECRVGAASVDLSSGLEDPGSMCGYAIASRTAGAASTESPTAPLFAHALCVEDAAGARFVFLTADLWGPSALVLAEVGNAAAAENLGVDVGRILFCATHTHSGPGGYFGNEFWNALPTTDLLGARREGVVRHLVARLLECVRASCHDLKSGTVGVAQGVVPEVGCNRSLAAFKANEGVAPAGSGLAGPGAAPEQQAIDRRLTALVARQAGQLRAVFATFGCHATALGQRQKAYHPDWPGLVAGAAGLGAGVVVALAQGAAGDVSPLPVGELRKRQALVPVATPGVQGLALATMVAQAVGTELARIVPNVACAAFTVSARWGALLPGPHLVGAPALAGAEDYQSLMVFSPFCREGLPPVLPDPHDDHWPKQLGPPTSLLWTVLKLLAAHPGPQQLPIHQVEIAGHRWVSAPGEPTTHVASALERAFAGPTTVVGYAGEYAGYLTTEPEHTLQHYEGALTACGRHILALLLNAHRAVRGGHATPPSSFDFTASAAALAGGGGQGELSEAYDRLLQDTRAEAMAARG